MTTEEEDIEESPLIHWNSPFFYKGSQILTPCFVDKPNGTDKGIIVRVDAQMTADLDWRAIHQQAEQFQKEGLLIFWEIYLGLFQRPLNDQTQFLSLSLALEHFRNTLWKAFQESTFGVSLYRGEADFQGAFQWNEEQRFGFKEWIQEQFHDLSPFIQETGIEIESFDQVSVDLMQQTAMGKQMLSLFCRNAVTEYLHLLAGRLPDEMLLCLLLDSAKIENPLFEAQLLSRARFDRFHLATHGNKIPHQGLIWNENRIECTSAAQEIPVGICMPPLEKEIMASGSGIKEALEQLLKRGISFKIIPEEFLITEWDGLEWIIVASDALGPQGKRKLQGFCAAGGVCITIGKPIGLPHEIPFAAWLC